MIEEVNRKEPSASSVIRRRTWCNPNFTFRAMPREWISPSLLSLSLSLSLPTSPASHPPSPSFSSTFQFASPSRVLSSMNPLRDEETLQAFRFSNRGLGSAPPGFLCLMPYCDILTPLHCCHARHRSEPNRAVPSRAAFGSGGFN